MEQMSEPDTATFHITIVIPVQYTTSDANLISFFCFDRYLNQWHFNIFWELLGLLGALKLAAMLYFLVLKNLMMNERIGLDFLSLSFIQIQSIPKQVILEQYWIAKSSAFAYFTIILK